MNHSSFLLSLFFILFTGFIQPSTASLYAQKTDTHISLFNWECTGTVGTNKKYSTTEYPGFIEFHDGVRLDGQLQVKKRNKSYHKFLIEANGKKLKLDPSKVARYGLTLKISNLTKGGKKVYKRLAMNFQPGEITLLTGEVRKGLVAFQWSERIYRSKPAEYYNRGVLFAASETAIVDHYENVSLDEVKQTINGEELSYQYMGGQFMTLSAINLNRTFRDGTITLADGTLITGSISMVGTGSFFCTKVYHQQDNGKVATYAYPQIKAFTIASKGKEVTYIESQKVYVPKVKETSNFLFYRNPYPTTVNESTSFLTNLAGAVAQTVAAVQVTKVATGQTGKENKDFNSALNNASKDDLANMDADLQRIITNIDANNPANQAAIKDLAAKREAIRMTAQSRKAIAKSNGVGATFYKKEWILFNKTTKEKIVLLKGDFRKRIEPLLNKHSSYIMMSKQEQKELTKWDNMDRVIQFLEASR